MTDHSETAWEQDEIESHLRSAMDALTPNVFDKIDLSTPQEIYVKPSRRVRMYRRMRTVAMAAAACLCVAVLGGGVSFYQNHRVDSVIGIDVNPSIELSVNRNEKVLQANPLNEDAETILDDMNLKNVDLDIAVNALIGSMVRNGYLDELDNAILVTVSNENEKKASSLRQDVVGDVESSLQEHAVQAVVYDQRMKVTGEIQDLAEKYNISYGKAYFLRELIRDNDLTENDMKKFAGMTMEEIAREIADRAYTVGYSKTDSTIETDAALVHEVTLPQTEEETLAETTVESTGQPENEPTPAEQPSTAARPVETTAAADEDEEEVDSGGKKAKIDYVDYESGSLNIVFKEKVKWKNPTVSVVDPDGQSYSARITDTGGTSCEIHVKGLPANTECTFTLGGVAVETTAAADEDEEEVDSGGKKAKIDYVDYESGSLNIVFKEKVKWKNPTVSVVDPDGQSYSARITDTGGTSCEIHVKGLPANTECTFTLGGVAVRDGGSFGTIKGYFETPDIADDLMDEDDDDADDETVETKPSETSRAPETLTEAVKESTHSETEYSQMETKQTEKETKTDAESAN